MAFKSEEVKQQARQLFIAGKTRKEVLAIIGDGATAGDLNNLAFNMRKAKELKPVTTGQGKKGHAQQKKKQPKYSDIKKIRDEFEKAVEQEIVRVESEIVRLDRLAVAYDKTMPDFAEKIERKITAEKTRLTALKDYQKN